MSSRRRLKVRVIPEKEFRDKWFNFTRNHITEMLTKEREKNDLRAYPKQRIDKFINSNEELIDKAIDETYKDYLNSVEAYPYTEKKDENTKKIFLLNLYEIIPELY